MIKITYQKDNGCIFYKTRKTMIPYKIGETTSMGWKVLNVEYEYENKFYPLYKYNILLEKNKHNTLKKRRAKEKCVDELKKIIYCFLAVVIINFLKLFFGI